MSNLKILLLLPLMLLASVFAGLVDIPQVHAATGVICISYPSTASSFASCPSTPPVFEGPVGQLIRIGVFISGSDGYNGFDITLLTNHTFLRPVDVDLTGSSLLGTPIVPVECLSGRLIIGATCAPTDSPDTLHLAATSALGQGLTTTNGLLFTAIYNITATNAAGSPLSLKYQTGCGSSTSPTSDPPLCVTVSNGTSNPNAENVLASSFDDSSSASMPFVVISANATSFGPEFPGVSNAATINATAKNGYPGSATNSVNFIIQASRGLTVTPSGSNPCAASCSIGLTLSASPQGNYTATVYGVYVSTDPLGNSETLSGIVTLKVIVYDFGFSVTPIAVSFISGEIGTATATVSSMNGFAGTITLANQLVSAGLTIIYNPDPIVLNRGGTSTSTLTFKAVPKIATIYHAIVKATFGTRSVTSRTLTISVSAPVPDFYFVANPSIIGPVDAGANANSTLAVNYVNGFTGTVTLSILSPSTGLNANLNQTSVTSTQTNVTRNVIVTVSAPLAKGYSFQVSGTNGTTVTHSVSFSVVVVDFNLTAVPSQMSIDQGRFGVSNISVVALNGFTDTVSLTAKSSPGLTAGLSSTTINGPGSVILNITLAASISPGIYSVNVTGVSSSLRHVASVNVTIVANDFSILAIPSFVAGRPNANATSTIAISSLHSFAGTVGLTASAPTGVAATFNATSVILPRGGSGVSVLTLNSTTVGSFHINVTATATTTSGSITHKVSLKFNVTLPGFTLGAASQSTITISEGSSSSVTIPVSADTGFTGSVSINLVAGSVPSLPASFSGSLPTLSLSSSTVTLTAGTSQVVTVTVMVTNTVLPNLFRITVNATNAGRLQQASFFLTVPPSKFSFSPSPATVTTGPALSGSSTITIASQGGLFGPVSLSVAQLNGLTCSLSSTSVTLAAGGSATTVLTCSGLVGSYNETITGQGTTPFGAGLTLNGYARFVVADFSLSSTPSSGILVNTSQTGHASISISWTNNYNGTVNLRVIPATGLDATLSSASVTGAGSITLNVVSSTAGTYNVVVNATSGASSHTISLTVTVTTPSGVAPCCFGVDPAVLSGVGVLIAAVAAGGFLVLRRRNRSKK